MFQGWTSRRVLSRASLVCFPSKHTHTHTQHSRSKDLRGPRPHSDTRYLHKKPYSPPRNIPYYYTVMPAATKADSRSPSPTPAPPIADAPGPRAQGLINVFNQASKATLDKCSSRNFAACFPTAAQYSPEVLDNLRGQILDQLDRTWKTNFEDIMARRNVVKLLNSLDQCIEDAKLRKKRAELSANGGPVETRSSQTPYSHTRGDTPRSSHALHRKASGRNECQTCRNTTIEYRAFVDSHCTAR